VPAPAALSSVPVALVGAAQATSQVTRSAQEPKIVFVFMVVIPFFETEAAGDATRHAARCRRRVE
jgi:hypothetical protein